VRKAYGSYSTSTPASSGGIGSAFTYLPCKEWEVLRYLAENPGKLVSKDELHQRVWPDAHVGPAAIDRAVSEVRQALGNRADDPLFIETVRGRGYAPAPQSWSSMCSHRERSFCSG
jgi:DNA-binding winged helix-turn-helix (wHTH) protein